MKIKKLDRIELSPNLLKEVIAQITFERNLEIEKDLPTEFQKLLFKEFPRLETQDPYSVTIDFANPEGHTQKTTKDPTLYHFINTTGKQCITLSSTFLAFTTSEYQNWDSFFTMFSETFEMLKKTYAISLIGRTGLRYRNFIDKSELSLTETPWLELINPQVLGHLYVDGLFEDKIDEKDLKGLTSVSTFKMSEYNLNIQTGFADNNKGEKCFFIDNDFYNSVNISTPDFDLKQSMEELHQDAESVFRHFISDKLCSILSPK